MKRILCVIALVCAGPLWADVSDADMADCAAAPSTDCLADIGFALAQVSETLDKQVSVIDYLGQMGRVEEAEVLAWHIAKLEGHASDRAERIVGLRVAPYQMIAAFMDGADLAELEAGPNGFLADSALMRMAGIMRTGSFLDVDRPVDPEIGSVLRRVLAEAGGTRFDRIIAADISLTAGEAAAARAILQDLPVDTSTRTNLSQPMIRLLGADRVWEIYQGMDRISAWWIADLARLSDDPAKARFFLDDMYDRALQQDEPRRRAFDLVWVIRTAMEIGEKGIAEKAMALQKAEIDPTGPEMRALIQSHEHFDTPPDAFRAVLRQAEKRLRTFEDDTSRSNALSTLAGAYAEIGDARRAARLLTRWDADARLWAATVLRGTDAETRAALVKRAERHVPDGARQEFLARVAAGLARPEMTEEDRDWARDTVWRLLKVDPPTGTYEAGYFYDRLLNAALRLGLPDMRDAVLKRSAETALDSGAPAPILQAAYQHYRLFADTAY